MQISYLAREQPLIVLIDGLEHTDEESAAFLHRLALDCRDARLMLVCTLVCNAGAASQLRLVERALRKLAQVQTLAPLTEQEHKALLQSVFGGAEHLTRLGARLYRVARGNPGQTIELCRQLVSAVCQRRPRVGPSDGFQDLGHDAGGVVGTQLDLRHTRKSA